MFRRKIIESFFRRDVKRLRHVLNETQWMAKDELEKLQSKKLSDLLRHAFNNSPYYREKFRNAGINLSDINSINDVDKLPKLSKEDLRENFSSITFQEKGKHYTLTHSGGTMGKPIQLFRDSYANNFCQAIRQRCYSWHSIDFYDRNIRFWGLPLSKKGALRKRVEDFALGRKRISPFNISINNASKIVSEIEAYDPIYMYGWVSGIYNLSKAMLETGLTRNADKARRIITTSEVLYGHQRKTIQSAWKSAVINEYGCSESGILAFECSAGNMHIMAESVLLEFVVDGHRAKPGEAAEILLTDLKNYATPLIRYRLGDVGRYSDEQCACGRSLPIIIVNDGRVLDTLIAQDGTLVHGAIFCYLSFDIIEKYGGIKDYRIIQKMDKSLDILIVPDNNFRNFVLELLSNGIRRKLGEIEIRYTFVEHIQTKQGKMRFVVSELSSPALD